MPVPHVSSSFVDLVDKRVTKLFYQEYDQLPDIVSQLYNVQTSSDQYEISSEIGALDDFAEFTGSVTYGSQSQGYDVQALHVEFTKGFQIERRLYDDDRHGVWQGKPVELANSASRTRQKHAARLFGNGFSVDNYFYTHSEAVSLFSNSHTTTSGASTATGFDNLTTASLSAVSLAAGRVQMMGFRDDIGNRISIMPDELWIPIDLFDTAYEIVKSAGKPSDATNAANWAQSAFRVMPTEAGWNYLPDANNWFLCDSKLRKRFVIWYDRIPLEFARAEELDTLVGKWRAYMRYCYMYQNWRWGLGAQVS